MNKKSRLTVTKKLFSVLGGVFCIVLLSCNNFLDGSKFKEQLEKDIAYAEAKECTVIIKSDASYGSFLSDGEKTFKLGYDSSVQFTVKTENYAFKGLEAVSSTDSSQSRSECVQFTALESDDKKGVYKFNVKLIKAADDILIRPVCTLLPKISSISPALEANGCNQDSAITIAFNKNMNPESFKNSNGTITGLSITNGENEDLSAYFAEPYFASDNKTLIILPLCLTYNTDNTKYLLPPDESKSSLNIKVNYTFVDVKDEDGLSFTENGTHSYKINKNFNKQEEVTVLVQNPVSSYGSFLSAGEKSCIVGFGFEIEFTLNTESYIFECFEAVSKNDGESRADCVAYENTQYDKETGVCRAKVRVLKAASDILIRPKCTLIENADVTISKSEKGTKNISPADGTKVQSFINRSYSVSITPDEDYEFIRWELYDIKTNSSITNGTYVKLEDPSQPSTNYSVTQLPDTAIELALRPVVAERPQIISNTPQNSGILKDSSIQVLFDHDMDKNSIYYTEAEVIALRGSGVADSDFLPALAEDELSGNLKNHYGYIKNGVTYYKNIVLTNNKTGVNLNDKYEEPFFENARTLTIPASKKEGKVLDHYTQILVTIEKGFFYKEPVDNITNREVTMRGSKKWMYQVTNKGDTDKLVFQTTGEGANETPVFELKLEDEEGFAALTCADKRPALLNDDNTVKSTLNFMRNDIVNEKKKPRLYGNMVLQDPAGGSGPKSTFTVCYQLIVDGDYATPRKDDNLRGEFAREYTTTTAQDAFLDGTFDLDLPQDGLYRIWFNFADRSKNDFYYPAGAEAEGSTIGFYVIQDTTAPNGKNEKISASADDASSYFKLSWTSEDIDFSEAIVSYKTNGTQTATYTVKKGENSNSQVLTLASMSDKYDDKYDVSIVYKDFAGNESEPYVIPPFMTGFTVTESTEKVLFSGDPLSDYRFTATAYFSDRSIGDISSSSIITSDATNIASTVEATFTSGEITRKGSLPGTYFVAASGAKPTESPVKLTDYSGTLEGGSYYKFGDFPQTVSALTGENAYSTEPVYKGWYLGSDGYFYEKCTENAYDKKHTYSDHTTVAQASANSEKYFKVEPIKWRLLTNNYDIDGADGDATGALLLAESILTANMAYYDYTENRFIDWTVSPSDYKHSIIRAYLNGLSYAVKASKSDVQTTDSTYNGKGFLQTAFTSTAQNLIATTIVDNSKKSTIEVGNNSTPPTTFLHYNSEDKIFLLSVKEATTEDYGFTTYEPNETPCPSRIRVTTDYAKANYAYQDTTTDGYGGFWWLRSAYNGNADYARFIRYDGFTYCRYVKNKYLGVVPALCVAPEALE